MHRPALLTLVSLVVFGSLGPLGCNSTPVVAQYDAEADGARTNACLTFGQPYGYTCQSGTLCPSGFVNIQDYSCGSTGQQCCGPLGEGGVDASNDAQVFIDGAVFETGTLDAGDAGRDGGSHDAKAESAADAHTDSGGLMDAGVDGAHHDGSANDGASDGHAPADASTDAKQG